MSENRISTVDKIVELRGGDMNPLTKAFVRLILIWAMGQGHTPTEGFQPGRINPGFGHRGQVQSTPRIAPKLQKRPMDKHNPRQGSCKSSNHLSIDKLAHSLSPEYSEFQKKYYSESLPKRFDTNNYSTNEFKKLAQDPRSSDTKFDRVSIDEARTVVQAKLEKLVIEPARPGMELAKRVDIDFIVQGLAPFTHIDIKPKY